MRTLSFLSILGILFLFGCSKSDSSKQQQTAQTQEVEVKEELIYYTCPMESHKHIHSDQPGTCPECGMKLVKAVSTSEENMEFYGCPMEAHSHIRSDKAGTCNECGMTLKPMRLVREI